MPQTQIVTRQIADQAITNAKIAAGAGIETSKLADGANFLKKDGSITMSANFNANNFKVINVATPTANTDAANKSYVDTQISNAISPFTAKGTVRAATTGNITLSGAQTIDGVSVVAGDRVLVKNQTTQSQNGIYVVASGAWSRASDMNAWDEIPGSWITVQEGTTQADTVWLATADKGGTLGTTAITFVNPLANFGTYGASNFVTREVPSGAIDGTNTSFTLANTPTANSEEVYLNGILLTPGSGNDYTISGAVITMLTAPTTGERLVVSYRK